MVTYKIFAVSKRIYDDVKLGASYAGGTCIDGTSDDDEDQFLLIIKYIIGDSHDNPIV
jgi:hypothetical protein